MPVTDQFWKKFYLVVVPLAAIVVARDTWLDFAAFHRAPTLRITFLYNIAVWILWLILAPGISWILGRILRLHRWLKFPALIILPFLLSTTHQLLHHLLINSTLTFMRLAWGTLVTSMFLAMLYAVKVEQERRDAEIRSAKIEKQLEEAKLLDVRKQIAPDHLFQQIQSARAMMESDPEGADRSLTNLAEELRRVLKNLAGRLSSTNQTQTAPKSAPKFLKPNVITLMCLCFVLGFVMSVGKLLDDLYVWCPAVLHWDQYINIWLSWIGVTAMTPFIIWMGRRFSLRKYNFKNLFAHLVACAIFFYGIALPLRWKETPVHDWILATQMVLKNGILWGFKFDVYGAVLLAGILFANLEMKRKEELREIEMGALLARAELDAVKMQLHPHFLFNALNSITELIHQDPKRASALLDRLAEFLQMTLLADGLHEIRLRRELDFIECYLEMQKVRFPTRLSVEMEIDPNSFEVMVPALILQPLVENAVRHGIAQNPSRGTIGIRSKISESVLRLQISDSGPGFVGDQPREGIGLTNTKRRLQYFYGTAFRLELQNQLNGGLEVLLEIPTAK